MNTNETTKDDAPLSDQNHKKKQETHTSIMRNMLRVLDAYGGKTASFSCQGQAMDGYSALAEFTKISRQARDATPDAGDSNLVSLLKAVCEAEPALRAFERMLASSLSSDSRSHDGDRIPRRQINDVLAAFEKCDTPSEPDDSVGWRLCSNGLPEVITGDETVNSVLVYKKNGFEYGSDIQISNTLFLRKHSKWVTHWMPLPAPPNDNCDYVVVPTDLLPTVFPRPIFTPGPWELTDDHYPKIRDSAGRNLVKTDCSMNSGEWDTNNALANARAIAAVPQMYAALERLEKACGGIHSVSGGTPQHDALWLAQLEARDALSAATGIPWQTSTD